MKQIIQIIFMTGILFYTKNLRQAAAAGIVLVLITLIGCEIVSANTSKEQTDIQDCLYEAGIWYALFVIAGFTRELLSLGAIAGYPMVSWEIISTKYQDFAAGCIFAGLAGILRNAKIILVRTGTRLFDAGTIFLTAGIISMILSCFS